jgi:hypothetical protein
MKTAWFALPVALLVVACSDTTAPAPAASSLGGISASSLNSNGVVNRVSVGGHDQDPAGTTDANFSLTAVLMADGSTQGEWSDQFGQGEGGLHVDVNCVSVAGNQAWISGIIRSGQAGGVDFTGLPAITRVADLGKSANDAPDAISFTFIGVAAPCTAQPNLPLIPMTDGQVTVN